MSNTDKENEEKFPEGLPIDSLPPAVAEMIVGLNRYRIDEVFDVEASTQPEA
jgi:hypothetical protein